MNRACTIHLRPDFSFEVAETGGPSIQWPNIDGKFRIADKTYANAFVLWKGLGLAHIITRAASCLLARQCRRNDVARGGGAQVCTGRARAQDARKAHVFAQDESRRQGHSSTSTAARCPSRWHGANRWRKILCPFRASVPPAVCLAFLRTAAAPQRFPSQSPTGAHWTAPPHHRHSMSMVHSTRVYSTHLKCEWVERTRETCRSALQ